MVEGARLESVYRGNSIEGSNPSLSAIIDRRSGEFDEGRRGWKKCGCLIHVSGTLSGKFKRKQANDDSKTNSITIERAILTSDFSKSRGYVMLDQWGPIDVREFRSSS